MGQVSHNGRGKRRLGLGSPFDVSPNDREIDSIIVAVNKSDSLSTNLRAFR